MVCVIKKKGINDGEISDIIEFSRGFGCVRGVVFQSVQDAGRIDADYDFRITLSEIRARIIEDEKNPFTAQDMIPLPCDPHKISVGYAAKQMSNGYADLFPVTGKIPKDKIKQKLFCCWPSFLAPSQMGYENVYRIIIMEFSDTYNFDVSNIKGSATLWSN